MIFNRRVDFCRIRAEPFPTCRALDSPGVSTNNTSQAATKYNERKNEWQKPKPKSKHKGRPRSHAAQSPTPTRVIQDPQGQRVRKRNALSATSSNQLERAPRPPPGRNRPHGSAVTSSSSTGAGNTLSQAEDAQVRALINGLSKKAKDLWIIIFQLGNARRETVTMSDFERVGIPRFEVGARSQSSASF